MKEGNSDGRFDKNEVFRNISNSLCLNAEKRTTKYSNRRIQYAVSSVAIIAFILTGGYFLFHQQRIPEKVEKNIFDPGSKKAHLLSAKGDKRDLSESFEMKQKDGSVISNDIQQGVITFQETVPAKKAVEQQTVYVPEAGEYELILSDGTKVFLNSESQLTFPTCFDGDSRLVELTGEVSGTSFNINAYKTNSYIDATLVEGSIRIRLPNKDETFSLHPNHNLRLDKLSDEISIRQVNTEIYTAWVRGEFIFRNQPLKEIFAQLERWYDFKIIYRHPEIAGMRFTGSAEKSRPLDYLLDLLQAVTDIHYKTEGGTIVLYKE